MEYVECMIAILDRIRLLARSVFDLRPAKKGGAMLIFAAERFGLLPVPPLVIAANLGAAVETVAV